MKEISLKGSIRTESGKKFAKQLRKEERVPAVVYGGKDNIMVALIEKDLKNIIYTPDVFIINLSADKKNIKCIIKDIQFHPVTDRVIHIDFLQISDDKKLTIALPVKLVGSSIGVKEGGHLSLIHRKVRVCGFPNDLPDAIEVDIADLMLGQSLLTDDLVFDKFEIVEPKTTVIATVKVARVAKGFATAESLEGVEEDEEEVQDEAKGEEQGEEQEEN
ncbi:MAG: 50S ribosomal protein L25 [Bacteroidales bacterium]|jgi:large subunit ribosomal protein L25|nr:50S ribosomal protein L25 [Bacteroidales bacterium]MDD4673348.1 50S ribosomal protein L25 [Bacteroidales bacterium]MDY0349453.1 50S ribosomal protein L25 [Tenuifilaceae bacterium]